MTVRKVRLFGDPVLTTKAEPVSDPASVRKQVGDMFDTMYDSGGVGLAANQIGVLNRVIVFDTRDDDGSGMCGYLINPAWKPLSTTMERGTEGCLSIPGIMVEIDRHAGVLARGVDLSGRPVTMVASGLLARCLQHETDHVNGMLMLDHLDKTDRQDAMSVIRSADWFAQERTK